MLPMERVVAEVREVRDLKRDQNHVREGCAGVRSVREGCAGVRSVRDRARGARGCAGPSVGESMNGRPNST
jgi:hypothetical protein